MEALSHLDPLTKDSCGLTVTEIKDFMPNLSYNDDVELYNRVSRNVYCHSHRVVENIDTQRCL